MTENNDEKMCIGERQCQTAIKMLKYCIRCERKLSLDCFWVDRSKKDSLCIYCKECKGAGSNRYWKTTYYPKNRERLIAAVMMRRQEKSDACQLPIYGRVDSTEDIEESFGVQDTPVAKAVAFETTISSENFCKEMAAGSTLDDRKVLAKLLSKMKGVNIPYLFIARLYCALRAKIVHPLWRLIK
jgi:hypothetical protein